MKAIVQHTRRKALDKEAKKQAKAGGAYVGIHSTLVSQAIKGLTETEMEVIEQMRTEWENKGPPPKARRL